MESQIPIAGIFIPTMNRVDFVIRQLRYYADVKCPHTIYIGDSSPKEESDKIPREIERLGDRIKAVYQFMPDYDSWKAHYELISIIKEKYACYSGDDDFQVPNSITRCIKFLQENPDYSTASGYAVSFNLKESGPYGTMRRIADYPRQQIEDETASDRIVKFFNNYYVTHFSVNHTKNLQKSWYEIGEITDNSFKAEILPTCLPVIFGKSKILDCLGFVRQMHDRRYELPGIQGWLTDEKWLPSYKAFNDRLTHEVATADKISPEKAYQVAEKAFWGYVTNQLQKDYVSKYPDLFQNKNNYLYRLIKYTKAKIGAELPFFKANYKRIVRLIPGQISSIHYEVLQKYSPYYNDFKSVIDSFTGKIKI